MFLTLLILAQDPTGHLTRGTRLERPDSAPEPPEANIPKATYEQHQWVDTVITQNYDRVLDCYREALARDPHTLGVIELELEMSPDGHPAWVELSQSTHGDPMLDACVANAVLSIDFARVDRHDSFVVRHALVLTPEGYPSKRKLMKKNLPLVEECLALDPKLRGIVEVRFHASSGRLVAPELTLNSTENDAVGACITASFPSWRVARSLSGPYAVVMRVVPGQELKVYLPD